MCARSPFFRSLCVRVYSCVCVYTCVCMCVRVCSQSILPASKGAGNFFRERPESLCRWARPLRHDCVSKVRSSYVSVVLRSPTATGSLGHGLCICVCGLCVGCMRARGLYVGVAPCVGVCVSVDCAGRRSDWRYQLSLPELPL